MLNNHLAPPQRARQKKTEHNQLHLHPSADLKMRPVKTALILAAAATSVLLVGCSANPVTGRSQLMIVPESMAITQSAAAYNQMMGGLSKKKQVETGTARCEKVHKNTYRLIPRAVRI